MRARSACFAVDASVLEKLTSGVVPKEVGEDGGLGE